MASYFQRSTLKSSNSPPRSNGSSSWRTVSFEDQRQHQLSQLLQNSPGITPLPSYYQSPNQRNTSLDTSSSFTSRDKRDYSRELHASFTADYGLSIEEITCDEIDDILPKTGYTYARTSSYSPRYSQEKKYNSPNMSRRRLRSLQPVFLSDDEEEFNEYEKTVSDTRVYSQYSEDAESKMETSSRGSQFSEAALQQGKQDIMTSTPVNSYNQHQISTNDHYYDGILLRSGSHIKGAKRYFNNQKSRRSESKTLLSEPAVKSDLVLNSVHRSDMDFASRRRSARNVTTVTETTVTETTIEPNSREQQSQKNTFITEDLGERKLRLDESQTEKESNRQEYQLKHLYGLDYEEEISDVEDVAESHLSASATTNHHHSQRGSSIFSFISTIFTTVITTVTSIVSDGNSSVIKPFSMAASTSNSIVTQGRWLLYGLADTARWLITRAATFLLWDIDVKQKRRRGCCCCLLPLLFLLPLLLLAGYYTRDVQHNLGAHLSDTKQLLSSSWSYLWFTSSSSQEVPFSEHSPPVSTPVTIPLQTSEEIPTTKTVNQIDMTLIYEYIRQAVAESAAANKDDRPPGLTKEQVEAIVRGLLASEVNGVTSELEEKFDAMKILLREHVASLQKKIGDLETEIKATTQTQQTLTDKLTQVTTSFEGNYAGQNVVWLAEAKAFELKLLNLTHEVNTLSSQNAALTAMLTNCCRNNSAISDIVRAHVTAILSQMSTDEDSQLASLMAHIGGNYVNKAELDQRLSAVSVEIMNRLKVFLAEVKEKSNASAEVKTSITGISESTVKVIVEEALTQFGADRVGMPDFALESAGGSVVSIRCSETYYKKTALVSVFGIPLWYTSNSPRTVIQPNVHPGECWAFKGQTGFIVFQLSHAIMPTGFTLEHIPRSLAPKGDISSAPKYFAVFGLISESDTQGISLGNYTYLDNGKPIQFFSIQNGHPGIFQLIELRILDNHGNREYTCVYRFRVHGQP